MRTVNASQSRNRLKILLSNAGAVSPTINLTEPDPECDLEFVPNTARESKVKTAVSTQLRASAARNAALVMRGI